MNLNKQEEQTYNPSAIANEPERKKFQPNKTPPPMSYSVSMLSQLLQLTLTWQKADHNPNMTTIATSAM
jgi:hypothetical protein